MHIIPATQAYQLHDYLLVLSLGNALEEKIAAERKKFAEAYKAEAFGKPHIALVKFCQLPLAERRFLPKLRTVAAAAKPFVVELKDFGSLPTHTIYISVATKTPFQNFVKNIRANVGGAMRFDGEHKPHFLLEPYVPIARNLLPWQYEKGWLQYGNQNFSGKFLVQELVLLRRAVGKSKFEHIENFQFGNGQTVASQGSLFS